MCIRDRVSTQSTWGDKMKKDYYSDWTNHKNKTHAETWRKANLSYIPLFSEKKMQGPSPFVTWLPVREIFQESGYCDYKLLLGTNDSSSRNYIYIAKIRLALEERTNTFYDLIYPEAGNGVGERKTLLESDETLTVETYILHEGPVCRVVPMPQNANFLGSSSKNGDIHIFEYTRVGNADKMYLLEPEPEIRLNGLKAQTSAVGWSRASLGKIAAGSSEGKLCLWNIEKSSGANKYSISHDEFRHSKGITDLDWHQKQNVFLAASGSDIFQFDLRTFATPTLRIGAHESKISSIRFAPLEENMIASGCEDGAVCIWDWRNLAKRLWTLEIHNGPVLGLEWHSSLPNVVSSYSADRKLMIVDLNKIKTIPNPAQLGHPEIVFSYEAHSTPVTSASWNPEEKGVIASIAEGDTSLHLWPVSYTHLTLPTIYSV
eukprot:TRINITY_DN19980_c0_g1_i1.p1 TRINITY_DN19980_c0_g1~~TRINITY_DN19980_c0_g1_i1.p1  ORF type:complete len:431 (+),score=55.42 TRINITY_DN19980_c0_g1_i1:64-1356(+)